MATSYNVQDCIVQHGGRHDSSSISLKGLFHATEIGQSYLQFHCKKLQKSGNTDSRSSAHAKVSNHKASRKVSYFTQKWGGGGWGWTVQAQRYWN